MGLNCKIHRGKNNNIEIVEAPNGAQSVLYRDALNHVENKEKALDIWSVAYTNGYMETNGDWVDNPIPTRLDKNGEPRLNNVLSYMKKLRNSGKRLSNSELAALANNMYSLPINSLNDLYKEVRNTFYTNGIFSIEEGALRDSVLYTDMEVTEIVSNPNLQNDIKNIVEKIEEEYISDNSKFDTLVKTYYFNDQDLLFDTNMTVGVGKYQALNPMETNKIISDIVGGVGDRATFSQKMEELPYQTIIDRYNSDSEFASEFFERYSTLYKMPVLKQVEGVVSKRMVNETALILTEVVTLADSSKEVLADIDFINEIPEIVWEDSSEDIRGILENIEKGLVDFNIDVVGLAEVSQEKNSADVKNYLNDINDFIVKLQGKRLTDSDINNFADSTDTYFTKEITNEVKYTAPLLQDRTLVNLISTTSEINLFKSASLIETDTNVFHKVKVIEDKTVLYDTMYELVVRDNNLLPKEAFYPTAYDADNTFNRGKLNDPLNKDVIITDMRRYMLRRMYDFKGEVTSQNVEDLETLIIYKTMFSHPLNVTTDINYTNEYARYKNVEGNFDYLSTDFIAEFYNYVLQNKADNSKAYQTVLRQFKFDERGITLENNNIQTRQQINLLAPSTSLFTKLKQYANISKDEGMRNIFPQETIDNFVQDNNFQRAYYSNNPNLAPHYKGAYDLDGDLLITNNSSASYVITKDGLFEKIQEQNNTSFYRQIPIVENAYLNNYKEHFSVNTTVDFDKYKKYMTASPNESVQYSKLYNSKEEAIIKQKIDECG